MVKDKNVRSLAEVMKIAKAILDAGKDAEFIAQCKDREDALFVVSTEAARDFIGEFLTFHQIDPSVGDLHGFTYGRGVGYPTCT
ncbi:hypothetical protein [Methylobacterium brachiatum]|uniref:hypothetical protein n=1 Tax=Methylobacterium brachiatum TaxID=269660 RepID=UPI0008F0C7FA|nr:hypothetical protein [Methylobacterium brachiatum]SFJ38548.1 hypothetical protein SAMN02799642_04249 [Methylobacterium brachiatum]